MLDTGICAPEDRETLEIQQAQLVRGKRPVQMFPLGTEEFNLPSGFKRYENFRGVFHYNPDMINQDLIELLSSLGRENAFLNLGPYNKSDIAKKARSGDKVTCVVEYTPAGVEVRCAGATLGTVEEQKAYFDKTKEPENQIVVGIWPDRIKAHLKGKM